MEAFIQNYGSLILFGALVFFMFRMHWGGHGGCGGMTHDNRQHNHAAHYDGEFVDADLPATQPQPVTGSDVNISGRPGRHGVSAGTRR